jgi:hypothetical protein
LVPLKTWFVLALRPDIVRRSSRVAFLVGSILAIINHGDRLLAGELDAQMVFKICLTYLVPYCVSTWASVQTARAGAAD